MKSKVGGLPASYPLAAARRWPVSHANGHWPLKPR